MNRILVVEDDVHAIKLYQGLLEKAGFQVTTATSGKEMFPALEKAKPDIILLDVILQDSNGLDLCRQLKKSPDYADVKVLMVSGIQVSPSSIAHGIDIGADDYLKNPFDLQELLSRIKNLLKRKLLEKELKENNQQLQRLSNHLQNKRKKEKCAGRTMTFRQSFNEGD